MWKGAKNNETQMPPGQIGADDYFRVRHDTPRTSSFASQIAVGAWVPATAARKGEKATIVFECHRSKR
jgi:hypothetical protein